MAKETSPAFQFYPRDFLSDENVAMMTYPELGMYWKLCCHCWLEGSIPGDLGGIARLLRIQPADLESAWGIIGKCFAVSRKLEGRLIQPRLERERDKQKYFRKLKSEQGKEGAKRRWNSHKTNNKNGRAILSPMANDSSSSSTSVGFAIASADKKPPLPPRGGNGVRSSQLFAAFWNHAIYPRLESPKAARKAWDKLGVDDVMFTLMLRWLEQARKSEQWQDKSLIPHPATWLNQRRWEGDPPPLPSVLPMEKDHNTEVINRVFQKRAMEGKKV
jgi:hypothetical protein